MLLAVVLGRQGCQSMDMKLCSPQPGFYQICKGDR